ncbi:hypothetical protein MKW98_016925 [Papaver atlanticum]|uniref:Uncharacterized protein n=1 Tax=Papaver atlanticum TaxID=357466 RepID=A0AAD4XVV9_9MAGN|nr:hypothetical protein MKW98_016925 [Papaver atlanticum]
MGTSSKRQLVSSFNTAHLVVALVLCFFFLGGFSYSAEVVAGKISDGEAITRKVINNKCTTIIEGYCVNDQHCATHCRLMKYSGGKCLPNDIDDEPLGICCCLN